MSWTELTVSICLPGSVGDAQGNAAADVDPHTCVAGCCDCCC